MDLRHLVPNKKALQRKLGLGSYDKLCRCLAGTGSKKVSMALRIEAATEGAVKAAWILGLETPPEHQPSPLDKAV